MPTMIFVNLPVENIERSAAFYNKLGFPTNPQFADQNATNAVISDTIVLMLLAKPFFKSFITKEIADTATSTTAILCISQDSRDAVDTLVDNALAAGAGPSKEPMDQGFMYNRSFADPDGHLFEVMWMDPAALQPTA
ncbi:MAG: VOC family protein [Nakamurella sp.]